MRFFSLSMLLVLVACRPSEQTVKGDWYELKLPSGWVVMPQLTVAQQGAVEAAWAAPSGAPDVRVILARPMPFDGDASAYFATQKPGLSLLGMQPLSERGDTLSGLPALVVEARGEAGTLRYWFFARDGMAGMLQCGGRAGSDSSALTPCDRIAASFRLTAALPKSNPAETPAGDGQQLELAGYRFVVPQGWKPFGASVPNAVWVVRSERLSGRMFPSVLLTVEPYDGDLDTYDRMGDAQFADQGVKTLGKRERRLLGVRAFEVDAVWPLTAGGHRALQLEAVRDRKAYVLTCAGDPDAFASARGACELISSSLELSGP